MRYHIIIMIKMKKNYYISIYLIINIKKKILIGKFIYFGLQFPLFVYCDIFKYFTRGWTLTSYKLKLSLKIKLILTKLVIYNFISKLTFNLISFFYVYNLLTSSSFYTEMKKLSFIFVKTVYSYNFVLLQRTFLVNFQKLYITQNS